MWDNWVVGWLHEKFSYQKRGVAIQYTLKNFMPAASMQPSVYEDFRGYIQETEQKNISS